VPQDLLYKSHGAWNNGAASLWPSLWLTTKVEKLKKLKEGAKKMDAGKLVFYTKTDFNKEVSAASVYKEAFTALMAVIPRTYELVPAWSAAFSRCVVEQTRAKKNDFPLVVDWQAFTVSPASPHLLVSVIRS
jgi:hypothetical protein